MTTIAFIGLGIMGSPMSVHLQNAGFDVRGYNLTPERTKPLVEAGGAAAGSIADAVKGADIVAVMVPDSPDVQDVLAGDGGVFANAQPGTLIVDFSSIRPDVTAESMGKLKPAFRKDGTVTPGNASQISDGASALVVMSAEAAKKRGLKPLARITGYATGGTEPKWVMYAPVVALQNLEKRTGKASPSYDLVELNEAFAAQVLACLRAWESDEVCRTELGLSGAMGSIDPAKLNVDGGAIALGHPVGASGARIVLHLLESLKRTGGKRGMAAICIGGGLGGAMLVERT